MYTDLEPKEESKLVRIWVVLLAIAAALPGRAQYSYPAYASVGMGFVQLADGGPVVDRWSTTMTFVNPSRTSSTNVNVSFYGDNGQPLSLNFGQGPSATLNLNLPAGGVRSVTSTGTSSTTSITVGWALVISDLPNLPITGVATYRSSNNGVTGGDVAAIGTNATYFYSSLANDKLGVAVVNPDATRSIHLRIRAVDESGVDKGSYNTTLAPNGHESFILTDKIAGLSGFTGSVTITPADDPPTAFAAWTLNSRNDILSTLPPGEMIRPGPYLRRHLDVAIIASLAGAAVIRESDPYLNGTNPDLIAGYINDVGLSVETDTTIRAAYSPVDNHIHISTALVQAMGASDAAMAFVLSHMCAHGVLTHTGVPSSGPFRGDPELLADSAAEATLLEAGFDPSGASDFYTRLLYASLQGLSIDPALLTEFAIPNGIPNRLQKLWTIIQGGCGPTGGLIETCRKARNYWHPSNPTTVP